MLAVIINPKSGKKHLKRQRHYLMLRLEEHCTDFTTKDTEYKGHATEIARDFVESGYDTILVWGGDGTVSETVNGIMTANIPEEKRKNIRLGLIPRRSEEPVKSWPARMRPREKAQALARHIFCRKAAASGCRKTHLLRKRR